MIDEASLILNLNLKKMLKRENNRIEFYIDEIEKKFEEKIKLLEEEIRKLKIERKMK